MRPLELSLALSVALVGILSLMGGKNSRFWRTGSVVVLVMATAQLAGEGFRWQLAGAYFAAGCVAYLSLGKAWRPLIAHALAWAAMFATVATVAAASLFPVFHLPALTGNYKVGTESIDLPLPPSAGSAGRKIVVQLFYPADLAGDEKRTHYMPQGLATRFKPQLAMVRTEAFEQPRLAGSSEVFALLIYAHSWNGNRLEASFLLQELASHGYVVACVDDPADTPTTVFADGSVQKHPGDHFLDFSSEDALRASLQAAREKLAVRVSVVRFVADELTRINSSDSSSRFFRRLDFNRMGVFGFSWGGTSSAAVLRADSRFKAGANLDGFSFGTTGEYELKQPLLLMSDGDPLPTPADLTSSDVGHRLNSKFVDADYTHGMLPWIDYAWTISGSKHMNFSDEPLYSRLRSYNQGGTIEPHRAMQITAACVLSFFDMHLLGDSNQTTEKLQARFAELKLTTGGKTTSKLAAER